MLFSHDIKFKFDSLQLSHLSDENLLTLREHLEDYRHAPRLYSGISAQGRREIREDAKRMSLHDAGLFLKDVLLKNEQDMAIIGQQISRIRLQATLRDEAFWSKSAHQKQRALRNCIDKFSYCSSEALAKAAHKFLPGIERWLIEAQKEVAEQSSTLKNINKKQLRAYQHYLTENLAKVQTEKKQLALTYFNRLMFAAKGYDLSDDDVLVGVAQKVKLIKTYEGLSPRHDVTIEYFKLAYDYVMANGTNLQQRALSTQFWRIPSSHYAYRGNGKRLLIVPFAAAPLIPHKRGHIFQPGKRARFELALSMNPVIEACVMHLHLKSKLELLKPNGASPSIAQLESLYKNLDKIYEKLALRKKSGFLKYFYQETNQTIDAFQIFCEQQKQRVIQRQVEALEAIAKTLKEQQSSLVLETKINQKLKIQLNLNVIKVENIINFSENNDLRSRFDSVSQQIRHIQSIEEKHHVILSDLIQGNISRGGILDELFSYHDHVKEALFIKPEWYEMSRNEAVKIQLNRFNNNLIYYFNNPGEALRDDIFRQIRIISRLGHASDIRQLNGYFYRFMNDYLQQYENTDFLLEDKNFVAQENLMLAITYNNILLKDDILFDSVEKMLEHRDAGDQNNFHSSAHDLKTLLHNRLTKIACLPLDKNNADDVTVSRTITNRR